MKALAYHSTGQKSKPNRFKLDQMVEAYDTFEHAAKENALKVMLVNYIP